MKVLDIGCGSRNHEGAFGIENDCKIYIFPSSHSEKSNIPPTNDVDEPPIGDAIIRREVSDGDL